MCLEGSEKIGSLEGQKIDKTTVSNKNRAELLSILPSVSIRGQKSLLLRKLVWLCLANRVVGRV
jgi:hypothetical protein